jgi:hypothetical protein
MLEFIIAAIVLVLFIVLFDRIIRIGNAVEIAAQSLKSMNKKLNALQKQLVPAETQAIANAEYDSKNQPRPQRLG